MPLPLLTQYLTGEFHNKAQAIDQPIWFVHLRLWHRLLPMPIANCPALFCEQANALYLDRPYRQRIVSLQTVSLQTTDTTDNPQQLQAQYWAFKQPERFQGAGANPDRLQSLRLEDLELLPGCVLNVTHRAVGGQSVFTAEPVPDSRCCFQYEGQTRQVILGFEASRDRFLSYDRGVEPETGKVLWGAMMGAYEFTRIQ